jgi:hypothetical protein
MEDHLTKARGKCSLCGQDICSATATYCVSCYRKCLKKCPTCRDLDGRLLYKYQKHQGMSPHEKDARGSLKECGRCGVHHTDDRQLVCPTCNNERNIFIVPEKEKTSAEVS